VKHQKYRLHSADAIQQPAKSPYSSRQPGDHIENTNQITTSKNIPNTAAKARPKRITYNYGNKVKAYPTGVDRWGLQVTSKVAATHKKISSSLQNLQLAKNTESKG